MEIRDIEPILNSENSAQRLFGPKQILLSIFRRRILVIIVTALGTAAAIAYGAQQVPTYTAKAQILIKGAERANVVPGAVSTVSDEGSGAVALSTQVGVLTSRSIAEDVIRELDLAKDPEFNYLLEPPRNLASIAVDQLIAFSTWLGFDTSQYIGSLGSGGASDSGGSEIAAVDPNKDSNVLDAYAPTLPSGGQTQETQETGVLDPSRIIDSAKTQSNGSSVIANGGHGASSAGAEGYQPSTEVRVISEQVGPEILVDLNQETLEALDPARVGTAQSPSDEGSDDTPQVSQETDKATIDAGSSDTDAGLSDTDAGSGEVVLSEAELALIDATVLGLHERLTVVREGLTRIISIRTKSEDPRKAARIANALARIYIQNRREEQVRPFETGTKWLAERLEELREIMLASEDRAAAFRIEKQLFETGRDQHSAEMLLLRQELIDARSALAIAREKHIHAKSAVEQGLYTAVPLNAVLTQVVNRWSELNSQIATYKDNYGELHPKLIETKAEVADLTAEIKRQAEQVIVQMEAELKSHERRTANLTELLNSTLEGGLLSQEDQQELRRYENEVNTNRRVYEIYLTRLREVGDQDKILPANVELISRAAIPELSDTPSPFLYGMVGFVGSFLMAGFLAFVVDSTDNRVWSAKEIAQKARAKFFSAVPKIPARDLRGHKPQSLLVSAPDSAYSEAIRAVQVQLDQKRIQSDLSDSFERNVNTHASRVVLVTSALPNEGKSTFAMSLAAAFAQSDARAIILELDLRRPSIRNMVSLGADHNVIDVLKSGASAEGSITIDDETGAHILATKISAENPTDALRSEKLIALLNWLRSKYEWIIIDSPPVLGIADTKVLLPKADDLVFVVRWQNTPEKAATCALDIFKSAGVKVSGVVLNQVDFKEYSKFTEEEEHKYYKYYKDYYTSGSRA